MKSKSHIVSMQTHTDAKKGFLSVAVCECGWSSEVPFRDRKQRNEQEDAIHAHWNEVGFVPEISQ